MRLRNEISQMQKLAGLRTLNLLTESDSTSPWNDSDYETEDDGINALLTKYDVDQEWFTTHVLGIDELNAEELSDLEYVEDRIQAHLSFMGADTHTPEDDALNYMDDEEDLHEGSKTDEVVNFLLSTTDGPVNMSTIIGRAIEVAWEHQASEGEIAEAVFEAMDTLAEEGGTIDSSEY